MKLKYVGVFVLSAVLIVLYASSAYAQQLSSLTPLEMYYGEQKQLDLTINNFLKVPKREIQISLAPIIPTGATDFISWTETVDAIAKTIKWNGAILTDASTGTFRFTARAPQGSAETLITLPVALTGTDGSILNEGVTITLKVDDIPPVLRNNDPVDEDYVLFGEDSLPLFVEAFDYESGLSTVKFGTDNCAGGSAVVADLICDLSGQCNGIGDLSSYAKDSQACFMFEALDGAGNKAEITGRLNIDGTAPLITLISPKDEKITGVSTDFTFTYSDNSGKDGQCIVKVDGQEIERVQAVSEAETTVSADLSSLEDGLHSWSVNCTDIVGLSSEATETDALDLDTILPIITLVDPVDKLVGNGYVIDIDVTDDKGVESVNYELNRVAVTEAAALLTGSSPQWREGSNALKVIAVDLAGNSAQQTFAINVDLTAPVVTIISPLAEEQIDYHVTFTIRATDNLDTALDCQITTNLGDSPIFEAPEDIVTSTQATLTVGSVVATANCIDDAGNDGSAQVIFSTIDRSGPDILFEDIVTVIRGTTTNVKVTATDYSGIDTDSVGAEVYSSVFSLNRDGLTDDYLGSFASASLLDEGEYTINYVASDMTGAVSEASDTFDLIAGRLFNNLLRPRGVSGSGSVTICHQPGTSAEQTRTITESALSGHLGHGDYIGACSGDIIQSGNEVILSGKVTDDRGILTGETAIGVTLHDGTERVVDVDENGEFSLMFTAPEERGAFITTLILEGSNGYTYEKDVAGSVGEPLPESSPEDSGGDSSSGRHTAKGIGFWDGPFDVKILGGGTESPETETEASGSAPSGESPSIDTPKKSEPRTPGTIGVGSATEVLKSTKYIKWSILLLALAILLAMYVFIKRRNNKKAIQELEKQKIFDDE